MIALTCHRPLNWVLPRLAVVVRPELLRVYTLASSCIPSTRVVLDVLEYFGIEAIPLSVRVRVFNDIYMALYRENGGPPQSKEEATEWHARGAWVIEIETRMAKNRWNGHLVVYIPHANKLIDPSSDQFNRPQKNIFLPSVLVVNASREFQRGRKSLDIILKDPFVGVQYVARKNEGYRITRHWQRKSGEGLVAARVIGLMEQMKEVSEDALSDSRITVRG